MAGARGAPKTAQSMETPSNTDATTDTPWLGKKRWSAPKAANMTLSLLNAKISRFWEVLYGSGELTVRVCVCTMLARHLNVTHFQ